MSGEANHLARADLHVTAVWLGPGLIDNLLRERAIVDIAGTTHRDRQVARGHNKKVIDRAGTPGSTGAVTVTFGIRNEEAFHISWAIVQGWQNCNRSRRAHA